MKFDDLVNLVAQSNDEESQSAVKHIRSYQHQLSLEILGTRVKNRLTKQEAANKAGVSLEEYESFETGVNMQATRDEYKRILNRLSNNVVTLYKIFSGQATRENKNHASVESSLYLNNRHSGGEFYVYQSPQIDNSEERSENDETKISRLFNKKYKLSNERYRFVLE